MFTPPPSPLPSLKLPVDTRHEEVPTPVSSSVQVKRTIARRMKWTVLLVPVFLMMITATTRYITHPIAFDVLSDGKPLRAISDWTPHKRHPQDNTASLAMASSAPAATTTASQPIPTIPSSPPTLPTPFPQPLDSLTQNFTSTSCYNFFLNMTNTEPFRSCRPFSLLLQSSAAFINSQTNTSQLNSIIWGTCNTTLASNQCNQNMAWFASALQSSCSEDLSAHNAAALSTLNGLQAYPLMRSAGCLADPITNSYCYVEAARNSNPSDLYFYQLPLGLSLPNSTTPSCSGCTKSLMALYVADAMNLTGLASTYNAAANLAEAKCGAGYVATQAAASRSAAHKRAFSWSLAVLGIMAGLVL